MLSQDSDAEVFAKRVSKGSLSLQGTKLVVKRKYATLERRECLPPKRLLLQRGVIQRWRTVAKDS